MAKQSQTPEPGTGGSLDDAVDRHAGILASEEDNREEDGAPSEVDETEDESEDEELEAEESESDEDEGDEEEGDEDDDEADADDSEGDEEDEEPDEEAEPTFKVKVDGEEVEVTQSELLAGYARQADYTRKTMALADERKTLQSEAEAIRGEREQYAALLPKLREQVEAGAEQEPDWDKLYADNPNEWLRQRELHRSKRERLAAIKAEEERVQAEQEAQRQEQIKARVVEEGEKLAKAIPEWADEEKAKAEKAELVKYAQENLGFTAEELSQIYDHRAVLAIRKAMRYDALQQKRAKGKQPKKGGKGPKTAAPGHVTPPSQKKSRANKKARESLSRSGSVDDAAVSLMDLLD